MSVKAWVVLTQDQFNENQQDWTTPDPNRPDYWVKLKFGNEWVNKWPTSDSAIEEAKTSREDWDATEAEPPQLVICQVEFDDETCINAFNAVQHGDSLGTYYAVCKEYLWYPSKEPVA